MRCIDVVIFADKMPERFVANGEIYKKIKKLLKFDSIYVIMSTQIKRQS